MVINYSQILNLQKFMLPPLFKISVNTLIY